MTTAWQKLSILGVIFRLKVYQGKGLSDISCQAGVTVQLGAEGLVYFLESVRCQD